MRIKIIILLAALLTVADAYPQEVTRIHSGERTFQFLTSEIDSITFVDASSTKKTEITKETYKDIMKMFKETEMYKNFFYCDFSTSSDTEYLNKLTAQCGQILSFNGEGIRSSYIKDGKMCNEKNYYIYGKLSAPINYIGMKYSYEHVRNVKEEDNFPPCVLLLGQTGDSKDPWAYIIHILFYNDKLYINTRHGGNFVMDCVHVEGTSKYAPKKDGEQYEVSAQIVDDKIYIRKPDGSYIVYQNEFFRETFTFACWQIYNKTEQNINGFLHELYAGDKPGMEEAFRTINTMRTSTIPSIAKGKE